MLGATVPNFVATANWRPVFVHPSANGCMKFHSETKRYVEVYLEDARCIMRVFGKFEGCY